VTPPYPYPGLARRETFLPRLDPSIVMKCEAHQLLCSERSRIPIRADDWEPVSAKTDVVQPHESRGLHESCQILEVALGSRPICRGPSESSGQGSSASLWLLSPKGRGRRVVSWHQGHALIFVMGGFPMAPPSGRFNRADPNPSVARVTERSRKPVGRLRAPPLLFAPQHAPYRPPSRRCSVISRLRGRSRWRQPRKHLGHTTGASCKVSTSTGRPSCLAEIPRTRSRPSAWPSERSAITRSG